MKKILELIKKLFGKKELAGTAVELVAPVVVVEPKPVAPKKKPNKKKKKNDIK
jgi:hypothetical protein